MTLANVTTAVATADRTGRGTSPRRRRIGGSESRLIPVAGMVTFAAVVGLVWQLNSTFAWWPTGTVPAPEATFEAARDTIVTAQFWSSAWVTTQVIVVSFVLALVLGAAAGVLFWKVPILGRAFEPLLVSFYAVPVIIYYPILIVVLGFGTRPIITLAVVAAAIPMSLNTWIGLRSVPDVYWRLSASLRCTWRQTMFRLALPAALPTVMAGVRLAAIYSVLATVAMEFLLANDGLGFQIRSTYQLSRPAEMVVYVGAVFVLSATIGFAVAAVERRLGGRSLGAGTASRTVSVRRRGGTSSRARLRERLGTVAILAVAIGVWQWYSAGSFVVASVPETLSALADDLRDDAFLADMTYTVTNIAWAVLIGLAAGAVLGVVLGSIPLLRRATNPIVLALNSVPKIIFYPLLLPIFHIGPGSQIAMGSIHAMFPMLIMMTGAVAGIPEVYRRLGRSLCASRWQTFWRITLPAVRKPFVTGARLGVSVATIGVILAEFFLTRHGLGRVLASSYEFAQYPQLFSATVVLVALSFAGSLVIWLFERRLPE